MAEIDERTDVYALGALLYEALTGRSPFSGHDLITLSGGSSAPRGSAIGAR